MKQIALNAGFFAGVMFCSTVLAATSLPTTQPTAAELVREVQQSELWFDKLKSFHLRAESQWINTPAGIEARRREIQRQFPDRNPTTRDHPELAGELKDTFELSFNSNHLRQEENSETRYRLRLWDGTRQVDYTHTRSGREFYAISGDIQMSSFFLLNLMWGRTADHHFWWIDKKEHDPNLALDPDDFVLVGRTEYRGSNCYVLSSSMEAKTLYVGVADHRLYGFKVDAYSSQGKDSVAVPQAALDALRKHYDREFRNWDEFDQFKATLSMSNRHEADRVDVDARRPFLKPYQELWMNHYVELVPGCFFPMREGYSLHDLDAPGNPVTGTREERIAVVELNPNLEDSLFVAAEFHEGARVDDWIRGIHYDEKKNRTPAEWQQLMNESADREAATKAFTDAENALIGKPAPAFPKEAEWINSDKPLAWSDFKGKVVLVDFFADWCGPCRNDLPKLADLHKQSKGNDITIIAIHPAGSQRANIDKVLKNFGLTYPICIDIPDPTNAAWGMLYAAYHIYGIPHAFVVDRSGNIVGHGTLAESLAIARQLAAENKKDTRVE
ncbi:MAG TPA: TlpA disulfide reductase family protein [Tepidisphaeraceae bacterium]|nr:TlpA disulfide reductase family protein [Tepidisphaeraceae bacterium]